MTLTAVILHEALRNISEDLLVSSESSELVSLVFVDLPFLKFNTANKERNKLDYL